MLYRIRYAKKGAAVFISQLDVQNVFQRAMRRARLNLAYSEGFNPHPKMSYGPPVPLFASSDAEFVDVHLTDAPAAEDIFSRLYSVMPQDIEICEVTALRKNALSLSDVLERANYTVMLSPQNPEAACWELNSYFASPEPLLFKRLNKKKKVVEKDARGGIFALRCDIKDGFIEIDCCLSLKSGNYLSPVVLIDALSQNLGAFCAVKIKSIHKYSVQPPATPGFQLQAD